MFLQLAGRSNSIQFLWQLVRPSNTQPHLYHLFHNRLQVRHHALLFSILPATQRIPAREFQELVPCKSRCYSSQQHLAMLADQIQEGSLLLPELPEKMTGLVDNVYAEFSKVPWVHYHNQPLALMQLLINEKLDEFMSPIRDQPQFNSLLQFIDDNLPSISDELLPCKCSFKYSGVGAILS